MASWAAIVEGAAEVVFQFSGVEMLDQQSGMSRFVRIHLEAPVVVHGDENLLSAETVYRAK